MRRTLPVAVVELDAMRRGAAEERGIEQIGATGAPGSPECGRAPARGNNLLGARCHVAAEPRDHHADGVEQMASGIVANLVGQRSEAKIGD